MGSRRETYFMCRTDYEYELGEASGGVRVYSSLEDLKALRRCVSECGVIEVSVSYIEMVEEGTIDD